MNFKDRPICLHAYVPGRKSALLFLLLLCLLVKPQPKKDSLWAVWKDPARTDSARLKAMGRLCWDFYKDSQPDSAILLADQAYQFAKARNLKRFMGVALSKKSGVYSAKGDFKSGLYYAIQSLALFREVNYENGIAACLSNIGRDYLDLGNYPEAVHYFYEALKMSKKLGDEFKYARTLSNVADVYELSGRLDSAIRINKYCLSVCEKIKDKVGVASSLAVLGRIYLALNQPDEALSYQQKALAMNIEMKDERALSGSFYNLGEIYMAKKEYALAQDYLDKSLALCQERREVLAIGGCYFTLGKLNRARGHIDEAIAQARAGLETIHYGHVPDLTYELYALLADLLEKKKDYKGALAMQKLSVMERDSTNTASAKSALYQEQIKYDFEKKELLTQAEHDKKLNALQAEAERKNFRKDLWLMASVALLFILLLSAWFAYHHFSQKNIINSQKNNILKQQLLVSQMSPHFIFNSLNAVQNFIFKQDNYHAGIYLKQFAELIRMILEFSRKDLIPLEEEVNFLQNYLALQKLRFSNKLNYELTIDPGLDRESVLIPPMLAQPFIENAIEHGIFYKNGEGFLSVKISLRNNTVLYEIEDNGIGMSESLKMNSAVKTRHKSLAIAISKERIEAMNLQNHTDFEIEIKDKSLSEKEATGVYVKFATPYLTL